MKIKSTRDIGQYIRKIRKKQEITQIELAGLSNVGNRFIVDLEKGKPTCEIEKVLNVLNALGIHIELT
jgi:y4mF family transcriptional regulator